MGGIREWFDVCFSNMVLLLAASPGAGVSALEFWAKVKEHLKPELVKHGPNRRGVLTNKDEDALKTVWVALDPYNELQNTWVANAGHVYRLYQAGLMNAKYAFLLRQRWVMFVLSIVLSFLTTPIIAVLQTPAGNDTFNKNKGFTVLKARAHGAIMQVRYLRDEATGTARNISEDMRSLYYFARGFMGSFAPIWNPIMSAMGQNPYSRRFLPTRVRYVVPFDPRQFLAIEAPKAMVRLETHGLHNYGFWVNDVRVGDPVWLTVPADARFIGGKNQYSRTEIPGAPMAILLTADVKTPVHGDPDTLEILMFKGDIFVCDAEKYPDLLTTIHLSWFPHGSWTSFLSWLTFPSAWLATQFLWLPFWELTGWGLGMARTVMQDKLLADTRQELRTTEHKLAMAAAAIETYSPTRALGEMLETWTFPLDGITFDECVILQFDRKGSTEASEGLNEAGLKQQTEVALGSADEVARKHGGFTVKTVGDCAVIAFVSGWPCRSDESHPLRGLSPPQLVQAAVRTAEELHLELGKEEYGSWQIRVGIALGKATFYQVVRFNSLTRERRLLPLIDGRSRTVFQDAAAYEKLAESETTALSPEAKSAFDQVEQRDFTVRSRVGKGGRVRRVATTTRVPANASVVTAPPKKQRS